MHENGDAQYSDGLTDFDGECIIIFQPIRQVAGRADRVSGDLCWRKIAMPSSIFGALLDNADVHMDEGDLVRAEASLTQARTIGEHLDSLTERTKCMDDWREREERLRVLQNA